MDSKNLKTVLWGSFKRICKEVYSPFADGQWNIDPYKIMGFICYIFAIYFASKTYTIVEGWVAAKQAIDSGALASLAGLPAIIGGFGTFLFGNASKIDKVYADKSPDANIRQP